MNDRQKQDMPELSFPKSEFFKFFVFSKFKYLRHIATQMTSIFVKFIPFP